MLHSVYVRNNFIDGEIQCELLKVGKKSRKIHGRGSENLRLEVAIAPLWIRP